MYRKKVARECCVQLPTLRWMLEGRASASYVSWQSACCATSAKSRRWFCCRTTMKDCIFATLRIRLMRSRSALSLMVVNLRSTRKGPRFATIPEFSRLAARACLRTYKAAATSACAWGFPLGAPVGVVFVVVLSILADNSWSWNAAAHWQFTWGSLPAQQHRPKQLLSAGDSRICCSSDPSMHSMRTWGTLVLRLQEADLLSAACAVALPLLLLPLQLRLCQLLEQWDLVSWRLDRDPGRRHKLCVAPARSEAAQEPAGAGHSQPCAADAPIHKL